MILLDTEIGKTYSVKNIQLQLNTKRRLEMLGMTNGTEVFILNIKKNGAMIIKVRGTRFAIGKQIASGITVGGENDERRN